MPSRLVTIATFMTAVEADLARNVLAAEGIESYLEGETTVGTLWHLGNAVGGVKLQVPEEYAALARAALDGGEGPESDGESPAAAGTCPRCGAERERGFAICWSCGKELPTVASAAPSAPASEEAPPAPPGGQPAQQAEDTAVGDAMAARAWKAAIIGLFLCPPLLHFYSAWTLLRIGLGGYSLGPAGRTSVLMLN